MRRSKMIQRALVSDRLAIGVLAAAAFAWTLASTAMAQETPDAAGTPLPAYAKIRPAPTDRPAERFIPADNGLPNIMLTGYWPPSNEMIRQFSDNPEQNPGGWVGEDWEGRGYNIYAYFPEFPGGELDKGEGDFEVDYQDTSADFWPLVAQLEPVAIITTGRGGEDMSWEVDWQHRNRACFGWLDDYLDPRKPTPCPPDDSVGTNYIRHSSLPMQAIADAVNAAGLDVDAFVDMTTYGGQFLCEYIGYHANWYHELHSNPNDPQWSVANGHIHVGGLVDLLDATAAMEVTLRTLIDRLDARMQCPGDINADGFRNVTDFTLFAGAFGTERSEPAYDAGADLNGDGFINVTDFTQFAGNYGTACP
jgi:hypothetical protein